MDMMERRIREVIASLLSRGAKALERTAGELEQAATGLRDDRDRQDAERVWADEPRSAPDTMIRSAPLRAVPDTPTDEARHRDAGNVASPPSWTPPEAPPETPERARAGDVDAAPAATAEVAGGAASDTDRRLEELCAGTVSQVRAQLGGLSPDELRRLRQIEHANRNRSTLIAAIDRALILTR
ncbi:MAG TPA: hypothetical protein VK891_01525 [Euzebyales bacterium]|nr:hypothetical protein [Euzebyales bacterium]